MNHMSAISVVFSDDRSSLSGLRITKTKIDDACLPHWHDYYEFEMCVSGRGEFVVNGVHYEARPGFICCMNMSDIEAIYPDGEMEVYTVSMLDSLISDNFLPLIIAKAEKSYYLDDSSFRNMRHICELLLQEFESDLVYSEPCMSGLVECFLIYFMRNLDYDNMTTYIEAPDTIQQAIAYINQHYAENPHMKDVAKMLFLDEHYFCTLFKKHMRIGYKDYLRKIKLSKASMLICSTSMPVNEIYRECGYNSLSHFLREFKEFYGMRPTKMRSAEINKTHRECGNGWSD